MLEYIIKYDPGADALYIKLKEGKIADSEEVGEGVIVDYDDKGEVIGIELIEFSKKRIDLGELIVKGLNVAAITK
ncbi:DUF2283 domain-containing protein [Candidatus Bathyarchaeota archaeon]|mgnify:FL=1|nr:MAG: DUF2283 domain-containing protein [Candidatus Bathyarchaeota archaeon]